MVRPSHPHTRRPTAAPASHNASPSSAATTHQLGTRIHTHPQRRPPSVETSVSTIASDECPSPRTKHGVDQCRYQDTQRFSCTVQTPTDQCRCSGRTPPLLLSDARGHGGGAIASGVVQQRVQSDLTWLRLVAGNTPSWPSHPTRSRARAYFRFGDQAQLRGGAVLAASGQAHARGSNRRALPLRRRGSHADGAAAFDRGRTKMRTVAPRRGRRPPLLVVRETSTDDRGQVVLVIFNGAARPWPLLASR